MTKKTTAWRNRIVGHGEEAPDQLLANPRNWRIHPKAQQDALSGVLDEVGWVQSVLVNKRTGFVVDGHLRAAMAISHGDAAIPVVYVDLSEEEEAEVMATLDPLGAMAATDAAKLAELLEDVKSGDAAVQALLAEMAEKEGIGFGQEPADVEPQLDRAEELQEKWETARGDCWRMGNDHLLFIGPASEASIDCDLAVFDPPFNWTANQQERALTWLGWRSAVLLGLAESFPLAARSDFNHYWVWDCGVGHFAGKGRHPASSLAVVLTFGSKDPWNARESLQVLDYYGIDHAAWPVSVVRITRGARSERFIHEKPLALAEYIVALYSKRRTIVGDPFAGGGSFLIACQRRGRIWRGAEIDPGTAAVLLEYWTDSFGIEPVRINRDSASGNRGDKEEANP